MRLDAFVLRRTRSLSVQATLSPVCPATGYSHRINNGSPPPGAHRPINDLPLAGRRRDEDGTKTGRTGSRCAARGAGGYYHSNAHAQGSEACEAYGLREAAEAREALRSQGAKECPQCRWDAEWTGAGSVEAAEGGLEVGG